MQHFMTTLETKEDSQSLGYFSHSQPEALFFFVHGWGGNPQDTWFPLSTFLLNGKHPMDGAFDAIFYSYDSRRQNVATSTEVLATFLRDYLARPEEAISRASNGVVVREGTIRYSRIILCSHSLGTVVSRGALIRIIDDAGGDPGWGAKVRQVLFAPAHKGVKVQSLLEKLGEFHSTVRFLVAFASAFWPAYDELKEKNIAWLEDSALEKLQQYPALGHMLKASTTFWARDDKVVVNKAFGKDPLAKVKVGETHTSICKPNHPEHEIYREFIEAV